MACFALGNPLLPVRRGELQCAALGMAVEIFDGSGRPLAEGRGELVCTRPFPSQPVGFWGDADGEKYRRAYFARFPGVWAHGDYAERTASGGFVIHGRSDAVLNPGGVRIGTGGAVPRRRGRARGAGEPGHRPALAGRRADRALRGAGSRPAARCGAHASGSAVRCAPRCRRATCRRKVLQVPDLPRTRSGKLSELAVRAVVHGEPPGNAEALANPEVLAHFRDRPELHGRRSAFRRDADSAIQGGGRG